MGDKKQPTTREKIVLEYLVGGVTYRELEARWGVDHATIQRWVLQHKGVPRNRTDEYQAKKNTIKPLPPPPVDEGKVRLERQLLEAQRKSCFSGRPLPLPKLNMASCCQKSILPSRQNCRATRNNKHQLTLPTAWSNQTGILPILPHSDPDGFSRRFDSSGSASLTSTYSQIGNP